MSWVRIESYAYWITFVATFLAVAAWESFRPRRELSTAPERRWAPHGIVLLLCTIISVGVYRVSPVLLAASVAGNRFGMLNKAWLPFLGQCVLAVLLLDLVKYATHRAHHSIAWLWRVHRVHHSDPDFDVSTATRVHPIEVVAMQGAYFAAIAVLAPPVAAVLVVEIVSCFQSFFGHANASLPGWVEERLRVLFYTPDLHRIHHSEEFAEQSANFGDIFPWWDRVFRTYLATPAKGQAGLIVGVKGYQNQASLGVGFMLAQPFLPEKPGEGAASAPSEHNKPNVA